VDFSNTNTFPYVIPYQMLLLWLGSDPDKNSSVKHFNGLSNISYGITWASFTLSIYNQATTRKRLLTQEATTYETIDFETFQNLLILTDTNRSHLPSPIYPSEFNPPGHLYEQNLQSTLYFCETEELPTGKVKTFHFTPESLPDQCWKLLTADRSHSNEMFPARQHTTAAQDKVVPLLITHFATIDITYKPNALPFIALDCPHITSEAGLMFA
jgi:hypothetical protein